MSPTVKKITIREGQSAAVENNIRNFAGPLGDK